MSLNTLLILAGLGLGAWLLSHNAGAAILQKPATAPLPGMEWQWNGFEWTQVPQEAIAL